MYMTIFIIQLFNLQLFNLHLPLLKRLWIIIITSWPGPVPLSSSYWFVEVCTPFMFVYLQIAPVVSFVFWLTVSPQSTRKWWTLAFFWAWNEYTIEEVMTWVYTGTLEVPKYFCLCVHVCTKFACDAVYPQFTHSFQFITRILNLLRNGSQLWLLTLIKIGCSNCSCWMSEDWAIWQWRCIETRCGRPVRSRSSFTGNDKFTP